MRISFYPFVLYTKLRPNQARVQNRKPGPCCQLSRPLEYREKRIHRSIWWWLLPASYEPQSICRLTVWYTAPSIVDRQGPLHYPTKLTGEKNFFPLFSQEPKFYFSDSADLSLHRSRSLLSCFDRIWRTERGKEGERKWEKPLCCRGKSFCRLPMPRHATQSCFAFSLLSEVSLKVLSLSGAFIPLLFTQVMGLYFRRTALRRLPSGTPPLLPHLFLLSSNHIPFVLPFSGSCYKLPSSWSIQKKVAILLLFWPSFTGYIFFVGMEIFLLNGRSELSKAALPLGVNSLFVKCWQWRPFDWPALSPYLVFLVSCSNLVWGYAKLCGYWLNCVTVSLSL